MRNKFTDEQLDLIAKNLLHDFAPNSETLNDIADSPTTWWKIKSEINRQKSESSKGWIEIWYRQLIAFTAFAVLAVGFGIGLIWLLNFPKTESLAKVETPIIEAKKIVEPEINQPIIAASVKNTPTQINKSSVSVPRKVAAKTKAERPEIIQTKTAAPKVEPKIVAVKQTTSSNRQTPKAVEVKSANNEEVKTEFISLSYLPTPESGQIVRVKVPRAMMVSLGVSNNVSKNSDMVSAEVILGDDGSSRAIRFISASDK